MAYQRNVCLLKSRSVSDLPAVSVQQHIADHCEGTCFVVIAMRHQFRWGELPGEKPFRSAGSDIGSFANLLGVLEDINAKCAEPHGEPGWHAAGKSCSSTNNNTVFFERNANISKGHLESIGVFLWQAVSPINQRIKARSGAMFKSSNTTTIPGSSLHNTS